MEIFVILIVRLGIFMEKLVMLTKSPRIFMVRSKMFMERLVMFMA